MQVIGSKFDSDIVEETKRNSCAVHAKRMIRKQNNGDYQKIKFMRVTLNVPLEEHRWIQGRTRGKCLRWK